MWILGAIVVLAALAAYVIWSASSARSSLLEARSEAVRLESALVEQDQPAAQDSLNALQDHFGNAHERTDGPVWWVGAQLPWIGDDVHAVRAVSAVGDDLSHGALKELVAESGGDLRERLTPKNGRMDLAAVEDLQPLVSSAHDQLGEATGELDDVETEGLLSYLRPGVEDFTEQIRSADGGFAAADRAVRVLPEMLGKEGPRTYLLMFNNNAEIRATGGLPGAWAVVRADQGRIEMTRQGTAGDVPVFDRPVLEQSDAEKRIYFDQIATYFQDTNFTPEFPRTAALVREMWQRRQGRTLDGVLSVDAATVSYLLRATGPIKAGGVRLTPDNATEELINRVYFRLPNDEAQNAFFQLVAGRVFDRVSAGTGSPEELVGALSQGVREGRVYAHSFDEQTQDQLAGTAIAGELNGPDEDSPEMGVFLNDATGSKMSYYLRRDVEVSATRCDDSGRQNLRGKADISYTKDSPPVKELNEFVTGPGSFGTDKGRQLVLVRLYGPQGGELGGIRFDNEPIEAEVVTDRGRPVATVVVELNRGQSVDITWTARSGEGQDGPVRVRTSPGLDQEAAITKATSACDA